MNVNFNRLWKLLIDKKMKNQNFKKGTNKCKYYYRT